MEKSRTPKGDGHHRGSPTPTANPRTLDAAHYPISTTPVKRDMKFLAEGGKPGRMTKAGRKRRLFLRVVLAAVPLLLAGAAPAQANGPIAAAPEWTLVDDVPSGCWAERTSNGVRVRVLSNRTFHPVLTVSRNDWRTGDSVVDFNLTIDGGASKHLTGSGMMSMAMIGFAPTQDPLILKASSLTWHLPWGEFTTDVTGIATVFAAVTECEKTKRQ